MRFFRPAPTFPGGPPENRPQPCAPRSRKNQRIALLLSFQAVALCAVASAEFAYEARIDGVEDVATLALMQQVSETWIAPGEVVVDPPASLLHLRRRANRDVGHFMDVFHSRGYYGATVTLTVDRDQSPVVLIFDATPGEQYVYGTVQFHGVDALADGASPLTRDMLGLDEGAPALADPIAAANNKVLVHLRTHGYPSPRISRRDVVVDHAARQVNIAFHLEAGPRAVYGEPRYEGLERVRPVVIDKLLPWSPGDTYDQRQVTSLRTRLYDTGLFATASVDPMTDEVGEDGIVPLRVTVTERPPRTVSAGLEYKSDEGAGAQFRWENRNMKGLGHHFSVDTKLATQLRQVDMRYSVDRYRRLDQALRASFIIAQEQREAFDSDRVQVLAFVEREVSPRLTLAAGAGVRIGRVKQRGETKSHELIFFPLEAQLDHSDDLLDPSEGFKFRVRVEPYFDPLGELRSFAKTELEFSHYLPFGAYQTFEEKTLPNWVLASRIHVGAILGESRDDVPADIRFYGGGGGSIRGYRYQTVSPLIGIDPIGGNSLAEFSLELRRRLSETLGIVVFVDGGAAFEASYPDFSDDIQFGAGLGVRYFTPLGPLRFDVAVPLNKRSEIDDAFQIYMSIGHAF